MENQFSEVFARIAQKTNIKNLTELAAAIERSQPTISEAKKKGKFPAEWAFKIELKYGISTRWIMTGKETLLTNKTLPTEQFLLDLETWAREISGQNNLAWLEKQLEECLPTFKMWRERKKAEENNQNQQVA